MRRTGTASIIWAIILITLGVGFLLNTLGVISFGSLISTYWPVALMLIGLGELIEEKWTAAVIWILLGAILLLDRLGFVTTNVWNLIWPLILIWIGFSLLIRSYGRPRVAADSSDFATATGVFSGSEKRITSENFKGANMNAVFGASKVDLRKAKVSSEGAVFDVLILFGGAEVVVPEDLPVHLNVTALFGGAEDKRRQLTAEEAKKPALTIRGTVLFGGIEIKD